MHDPHEREQSRFPLEDCEIATGASSLAQYLTHLLCFCQQIRGARDAAVQLSQEIARMIGNQVYLRLHKDEASTSVKHLPAPLAAVIPLDARCGDDLALLFFRSPSSSASALLSFAEIEALAQFCNFALPSLKRAAFIYSAAVARHYYAEIRPLDEARAGCVATHGARRR